MRPLDTSIDAEKVQIGVFKAMAPAQRLRAAMELSQMSRRLLSLGVQRRHPEYDERHVHLAVIRLILPQELFLSAYPEEQDISP